MLVDETPTRDVVDVVDVVVVGAGAAGAAAAYSLARRGASVVIVEQADVAGYHATGRSASVLSATSGLAPVCRLANASRPFFERPPAGFADVDLLSPRGLLWIGQVGDAEILDAFAVHAAETTPVRRLTVHETLARLAGFRAPAVGGGAVAEDGAMAIDTAALLDGLLRGVRQAGGRLVVSAEAVQCRPVEDSGHRWQTLTSHGVFTSRHVVNAAGAWADVLAGRAGIEPVGLRPLRRTAALVPVAAAWEATVSGWPLVMDIAGRFYCEPESGGLLVSPADETLSPPVDARPEEEDVAWALHQLDEATELGVRSIRRAWAGLRTFAPDRLPVVGEEVGHPGFWWLAGQGGAGIKIAPALGELTASLVLGASLPDGIIEADLATFAPGRFRTASPAD